MALDITKERGVPLDRQVFTWRELAGPTFSKLDDDAFTRVRVILMNGIESEAVRFSHSAARMNARLQGPLARVRRSRSRAACRAPSGCRHARSPAAACCRDGAAPWHRRR